MMAMAESSEESIRISGGFMLPRLERPQPHPFLGRDVLEGCWRQLRSKHRVVDKYLDRPVACFNVGDASLHAHRISDITMSLFDTGRLLSAVPYNIDANNARAACTQRLR
jgi:hypothetical protein